MSLNDRTRPAFSKKQYEIIASVLRSQLKTQRTNPPRDTPIGVEAAFNTWRETVERFSALFSKDSPRFDATRFEEACGLEH